MSNLVFDNLKNILGWKTSRKLIAFAVDDYGNVRLHSKEAREKLNYFGLKVLSRFDAFDAMETREDLEILYDTLTSVKDINRRPAIFTTFALPCNINFEKILEEKSVNYEYESLDETLDKLESFSPNDYSGVKYLLRQGIESRIIMPEFHGREHLNIKAFENKLKNEDQDLQINLNNRSFTSIQDSGFIGIGITASFSFYDPKEVNMHFDVIESGIQYFRKVYGYSPIIFTPPAQEYHVRHESVLQQNGIIAIDKPLYKKMHLGFGKYKSEINCTSYNSRNNLITLVRNCLFEPSELRNYDWVSKTLSQIETAFRWNKPAIISSHRVNFCGHICKKNRENGISELDKLLKKIVKKWPQVEFVSLRDLALEILESQ